MFEDDFNRIFERLEELEKSVIVSIDRHKALRKRVDELEMCKCSLSDKETIAFDRPLSAQEPLRLGQVEGEIHLEGTLTEEGKKLFDRLQQQQQDDMTGMSESDE